MMKIFRIASAIFAVIFVSVVLMACGGGSGTKTTPDWTPQLSEPVFFHHHNVLRVSEDALINRDGTINTTVFARLKNIINSPVLNPLMRNPKTNWPTGLSFTGEPFTAITAEDFSNFVVPNPRNRNDSGAIVIRLFESIPNMNGVSNAFLTELTNSWWQLVYRSTAGGRDVLTLQMVNPYRTTVFNGNRNDRATSRRDDRHNPLIFTWVRNAVNTTNTIRTDEQIANRQSATNNFFLEGNYSRSIARQNLLRDANMLFENFEGLTDLLTAPINIPGNWQSSAFQTGTNVNGVFYVTNEFQHHEREEQHRYTGSTNPAHGLGATGTIWGTHFRFAANNGMDGLSVGPYNGGWRHTTNISVHNDLLWFPSDFETRTLGYNKDNARKQSFIRNANDPYSPLIDNYQGSANTPPDVTLGRAGLWRLNGFDRAFCNTLNDRVWLRSTCTMSMSGANTVYYTGNRYIHSVVSQAGMRPALHLDLVALIAAALAR